MDKRAVKILFDTYWSASRWIDDGERQTPPEDYVYAKSKGVMFDPRVIGHSMGVTELLALRDRLTPRLVADAFLASLSTRRLDWRSALGSYAVFRHLQPHPLTPYQCSCTICGSYGGARSEDLNVLNFERLKWGGVRHEDVVYAGLDLRLFLQEAAPSPTPTDIDIFRDLLSAISNAPPKTTGSALHKHFPASLKANKAERDTLIGILGFCGILSTPEHPGFACTFVPFEERCLPDHHYVDMAYPACWWRSENGLNVNSLADYFGHVL